MPVLAVMGIAGCASMGPPGGGPKDEEGPVLLEITPEPGSTNVDPDQTIELLFSEPIEKKTLESALFITPVPEHKPKIKVRGSKATIKLRDPIPMDRTLVIGIGSGTRDLRGNKMTESVTSALSAGDRIDQGGISGTIFSVDKITRMLVAAWLIGDSTAIEPDASNADFLTQSGMKGEFSLEYLPAGLYRLACWEDRNSDRKYNPVNEQLGLASRDVELAQDGAARMELYPTKRDTSGTRLLLVSASDRRHVSLRFTNSVDSDHGVFSGQVSIADSSSELIVLNSWREPTDSSRVVLYCEPQQAGVEYFLTLPGDTTSYIFEGSAAPDTIALKVVASSPRGNSRDLPVQPYGWIAVNDGFGSFGKLMMIDGDSSEIPLDVKAVAANILTWKTFGELPFGTTCHLIYDMSGMKDLSGNAATDSARFELEFSVVDPAETGSISGRLRGGQTASIIANAIKVGSRASTPYPTRVDPDGEFKIELLPAGQYRLWAFEDADQSGKYSFGQLTPFIHAERFTIGEDTIKVDERWDTGGVRLEFK